MSNTTATSVIMQMIQKLRQVTGKEYYALRDITQAAIEELEAQAVARSRSLIGADEAKGDTPRTDALIHRNEYQGRLEKIEGFHGLCRALERERNFWERDSMNAHKDANRMGDERDDARRERDLLRAVATHRALGFMEMVRECEIFDPELVERIRAKYEAGHPKDANLVYHCIRPDDCKTSPGSHCGSCSITREVAKTDPAEGLKESITLRLVDRGNEGFVIEQVAPDGKSIVERIQILEERVELIRDIQRGSSMFGGY